MSGQLSFIGKIKDAAIADMKRYGILASLKIAQAILESAWGLSLLATEANALFGIKADERWNGRIYTSPTSESGGAGFITRAAAFRAYDSWDESITDHSIFLVLNSRYITVLSERDYKKACRAIQAAGYATDPRYADKLIQLIEQFGLYEYDREGGEDLNITNTCLPAGTVTQDFIPVGRLNRPGRVNPMKYITIHETGNTNAGAGARNHANYIKGDAAANEPVSWHYTTDDKETYQHLPETEDAFHAADGAGPGNRQSIGIEMCVNSDGDFAKTVERTAELAADICRRRDIPVENIVQHHNWSRKNCPQNLRAGRPMTWAGFIDKVRGYLGKSLPKPEEYLVRAKGGVNIRNGAGMNYSVVGTIERDGAFTIVKEQNGFGRLKSGAGWLNLAETQRV